MPKSPEQLAAHAAAVRRYNQTAKGKMYAAVKQKRQRALHPTHFKARAAAQYAVKVGLIYPRGCEVCGRKAQMHHDEHRLALKVRWLCPLHHREADKN